MTVQITVRGRAERRFRAELAAARLTAQVEGPERAAVARQAVATHSAVTAALRDLEASGAVLSWVAEDVSIVSHRRWQPDGARGDLVQVAQLAVTAEFADFEALGGFLDTWSGDEHVAIDGVEWRLADEHRRTAEAQVRADAVRDAVAKAQAYADAVSAGPVVAVRLADPGMLSPGEPPAAPMFARMAADTGGGPVLDLHPDEIVVHCEVDAVFEAE